MATGLHVHSEDATEGGFASVNIAKRAGDVAKAHDHEARLQALLAGVRSEFASGKTKDLAWRKKQLGQLVLMIQENHEAMTAAVTADLGGPKTRGLVETAPAFGEAQLMLKHLDAWAADEKVSGGGLTNSTYVRHEPKGVVLIISPWNYPIALVLTPLASAIAAGNCVVIKPSEVSTHCAAVLGELIPRYLDPACVKVVQGAVPETTALLSLKWDHIMYTGNGSVGRIVMEAAAKHLTPVTLELGGKSPTYVDKSADLDLVAARLSAGKWLNAGQTCIAPDYILVHRDVEDALVGKLKAQVQDWFGGNDANPVAAKRQQAYGKIINERHVARIRRLVDTTVGTIVTGGADVSDESSRFFAPTIVRNPGLDDPVMTEEIFGPVLPIVAVDGVHDAVTKSNAICSHPLALYVFGKDRAAVDTFMAGTTSGSVCINGAVDQNGIHTMPFGGVGESGMGAYHGRDGFLEFSHRRAVLDKDTTFSKGAGTIGTIVSAKGNTDQAYSLATRFLITGLLSATQSMALKAFGVALVAAVGGRWFMRSRI